MANKVTDYKSATSGLYKTLVSDLKILYLSNQQIKNIHYEKSKKIKKKPARTYQRR